MSKNRAPLIGLAALGGIGYYMYSAGGDPAAAGDKMKHDVDKARHSLEGEKSGEKAAQDARSNFDAAAENARIKASSDTQAGINRLDGIRQDATAKAREGVDKFDKTVEDKASEAKGKVSGWFGGSK